MTNYIRRRQQRGVILLAIISLLTMFMLIGITYVVVSGHFKRAAVTNSRVRQLEVPPQKHLDGAMYQLLRDTDFAGSVVRGHSLLQDKYGHYSVEADVVNCTRFANTEQILDVIINKTSGSVQNTSELTGRVITFLDDSINISGHILHAELINVNRYKLQILVRDRSINISEVISRVNQDNRVVKILINGRDFSGTGFGLEYAKIVPDNISPSPLDPVLPKPPAIPLDPPTKKWQITTEALWPNRAADTKEEFDAFRFGGANEGYDVPDYQNMAMAALISNSNTRELQYIIPSFHRPALINYWKKRLYLIRDSDPYLNDEEELAITKARTAAIMNKIVMRPRKEEHPFFTGSNPSFHPINGPWDVDNDGDGIRDSIWIDMGFPIQTDASGRQYKPLFAVLCLDMDGRLNLNAHGNQMHYQDYLANPKGLDGQWGQANVDDDENNTVDDISEAGWLGSDDTVVPLAGAVIPERLIVRDNRIAGVTTSAGFPRGSGFGPAEINLNVLFGSGTNDYQQLLEGLGETPGRYGSDNSPGKSGPDTFTPYIFGHFPDNFVVPQKTSFQSMPDIHGELAYGINRSGNVVYEFSKKSNGNPRNTKIDNPYEANLVSPQASDQLFNAHEMEALLRYQDPDNPQFNNSSPPQPSSWKGGSSRLYQLTNTFSGNSNYASANRRSVTTASFDPPVPSIQIPKESRTDKSYGEKSVSFSQLLKSLLRSQGAAVNDLDQIIRSLNLNPKFFSGLKMDVNQPFGDGLDNNNDDVVDNPIESSNAYLDRRDYARNLYIMMLLMKDKDRIIDFGNEILRQPKSSYWSPPLIEVENRRFEWDATAGGQFAEGTPAYTARLTEETHRNIAQWAVNVVDFRDADSIMTPFEFDLNPFNGWDVDGIIGTADDTDSDRALVWGTERPELLITESLAFHDRRTEDRADEQPNPVGDPRGYWGNDALTDDTDFDQRLRPRSGVFIELYNPWQSPADNPAGVLGTGSWKPREFYDSIGNGLRLDKISPNGTPVWRIIVVRGDDRHRDPDHWDRNQRPKASHVERAIYFTKIRGGIETGVADYHGREQFYTSITPAPLLPGRYAVIGSSNHKDGGSYKSYVGRSTLAGGMGDPLNYDNTRRIVLTPKPNAGDRNQVRIYNKNPVGYGDPEAARTNHVKAAAIALPINKRIYGAVNFNLPEHRHRSQSLSITDPVGGYTEVLKDRLVKEWPDGPGEPELEIIADVPLDTKYLNPTGDPELERTAAITNGTTLDYAVIHLQRLANPLQAYDPTKNPYRTIDSHSVDVTAFNGIKNDVDTGIIKNGDYRFNAHQRGDADVARAKRLGGAAGVERAKRERNLWKHEQRDFTSDINPAEATNNDHPVADHVFTHTLRTTLGFLNTTYKVPRVSDSDVNESDGEVDDATGNPFPWLQWNNRPFVSQLELMMVPKSSSSQLLYEYSHFKSAVDIYDISANDTPHNSYNHLLNFFESDPNRPSSNFHRLFDYTEVQSYFTGAQTYYKNSIILPTFKIRLDGLNPPFKRITNYRDPGRINLNTIFDPVVFKGLMNRHAGPNYAEWFDSRQAWEISNNYYPTYFANPIRPAGSGDMVPPIEPLPSDYFKSGREMNDSEKLAEFKQARHRALLKQPDVEVGLLRSNRNNNFKESLFNSHYTQNPNTPGSYDVPNIDDTPRDANRNPSFKYQSLQRLGNLVTGRSNVYSVWITVGYFEVTPKTIRDTFHPTGDKDVNLTGYQLGAEVGIDDGRIKRHRAFYMIDRSIPVAFEPGENHNVDNAVILRRYID